MHRDRQLLFGDNAMGYPDKLSNTLTNTENLHAILLYVYLLGYPLTPSVG